MDLEKCLLLLFVVCLEYGESGGHGGKHHDHVNIHVPEFIHHDHHTKVITIHHHHHKPKKEHHHHHHHHHKPHVPHGHHYHHHHKKAHTTSHTESKGHHGHHGKHGHHGHHGHHHKSHGHGHHHHDTPSYDPPPSFESDYTPSYTPVIPSYGDGIAHHIPQVHGITHTVKQVKVFDSLPGVIPNVGGGQNGYEVTENGEEGDEDVFTSINGLQQSYPATYGYLRGASQQPSHDLFAELTPQNAVQTNNHLFSNAVPQPTVTLSSGGSFPTTQHDPFAPDPTQSELTIQPSDFPTSFHDNTNFSEQPIAFAGTGGDNSVFLSNDDNSINDGPVSFSREAGIHQSSKTGGVETLVY